MPKKLIPLNALEGEVRTLSHRGGKITALFFVCPVCLEHNGGERAGVHSCMVPFRFGEKGGNENGFLVWDHVSGTTADDLTLAPSYLAGATVGVCRFHCFVRNGVVEVLGDSFYRGRD